MKQGKFIVIEGPNGVGKSTIIESLNNKLRETSFQVVTTKEPTYSELGIYIRKNQDMYRKEVLACLVVANRYEHIETVIRPAILEGKVVLSDRYFPSSLVYQGMDGLDSDFVHGLNQKIIVPDLTVFLYADENLLKSRLKQRSEITRFERDQQLEIELYKEASMSLMAKGWNIIELDTSHLEVMEIVNMIIGEIKKI